MANLDCLVTKENADDGVWFRVVLYGKEQPFSVKLLGSDSDVVINYAKEKLRKLKNKKTDEDESLEVLFDTKDEDVLIRICELRTEDGEPIVIGDREIKNTKEDYRFLIEKIPAIKEFVLEKSNERKNFLLQKKKD